jgi:hypothetical protein
MEGCPGGEDTGNQPLREPMPKMRRGKEKGEWRREKGEMRRGEGQWSVGLVEGRIKLRVRRREEGQGRWKQSVEAGGRAAREAGLRSWVRGQGQGKGLGTWRTGRSCQKWGAGK